MSINRGAAPPNKSTGVGKMRYALGDQDFVPLDPPETGFGSYQLFSDDELEVLLELSGGSIPRAVATAYRKIGASWAATGATIKTNDLTYSAKDSVGNWLALAEYWDKVADREEQAAIDSIFMIVPVGRRRGCVPEGSPTPWPCPHSLTRPCGRCSW